MREIKDDTDGEIYHIHELEESIELNWVYYPKPSIDSMQSLSSYKSIFLRTRKNNFTMFVETKKERKKKKKKKKTKTNTTKQKTLV